MSGPTNVHKVHSVLDPCIDAQRSIADESVDVHIP